MEREIMKAIVARDIDELRAIFIAANKGMLYVKPDLLCMVGNFIKKKKERI